MPQKEIGRYKTKKEAQAKVDELQNEHKRGMVTTTHYGEYDGEWIYVVTLRVDENGEPF